MNTLVRIILTLILAIGGAVIAAAPAQAANYQVSYTCNPVVGGGNGMSVKSNYNWYAFYPCQTRESVTSMRVWAHSCVKWSYYGSSTIRTNCNYGTGNVYVNVLGHTFIRSVYKV
jgi:hypothetical protein